MSTKIYKTLFKVHSWLGLITGIFLLIVAVTGSLLVYQDELDKWLNRDVLTVEPSPNRLSLDSIVQIVREKFPRAAATNILHFPEDERDVYEFRLYDNAVEKDHGHRWDLYVVDIDPYTGDIVRQGNHRDFSLLIQWMHTFHYSLHAGSYGILILAIVCLTLFASIITGIIVYRKYIIKVLLFRVPIKFKNWRTASSDLHRVIGVWCIVLNILIFYSGLEMNWTGFDPDLWETYKAQQKLATHLTSLDSVIERVQTEQPGFYIRYFYIPFVEGEKITASGDIPGTPLIIMRGASRISFDPHSGDVAEVYNVNKQSFGTKVAASTYSFHVGSFAGHFSRILYIFVGLSPGVLAITGFILWWRRKRFLLKC